MATPREAPTIVRAVPVTEDHLAVVLNDVIGPVTDENVSQIWHELARDVGWCEYHRSAPQQMQTSKPHSGAPATLVDAREKHGKERKSGRRAGRKHKGHSAGKTVGDMDDMAVAVKPQVLKDSDFLIEETEGEESDEASQSCEMSVVIKPQVLKDSDFLIEKTEDEESDEASHPYDYVRHC